MKKISFNKMFLVAAMATTLGSCIKKLDIDITNGQNAASVYSTASGYRSVMSKVYGSFATTGNNGAGSGDIAGIDAGTSDFFRLYWKAQELSTDEAIVGWGDVGIQDFHNMNWTSSNPFLTGLYYRSLYQITLCNEFIRQSTDAKLAENKITGTSADSVRLYRNEARFLRAYQYSVLMDIFGNPPFATEATTVGGANPTQISRANLFAYVVNELKDLETKLALPRQNEYGRADRAAAWALLARVYLNGNVYTGATSNDNYSKAIEYSQKVIGAGYSLLTDYTQLMRADNNIGNTEAIFTLNYDGLKTQNYGGTTFLTRAAIGGSMNASNFGVASGWGGIRTTKAFVQKYPDISGFTDKRAQFYQNGQNLEIASVSTFTDGYAITKYRNVTRTGSAGSNSEFSDIDFPLFRLAEQYLIYAEAVLRGGTGGDLTTALNYVNLVRTRAFGNNTGNIINTQLTLDWILDERARELYWEGFRRTDLIRYNQFVESTYLWPWKGGSGSGSAVPAFRKLYPIPSADVNANLNLTQNPGY